MRCLAHIINLIVRDFLSRVNSGISGEAYDKLERREYQPYEALDTVTKVRTIVGYINRSPTGRPVDQIALYAVYMPSLRKETASFVRAWNVHNIRKQPRGQPSSVGNRI